MAAPYRGPDREARSLYFALGLSMPFATDLHLRVAGKRTDLVPMDDLARRRLQLRNPIAARADLTKLTHALPRLVVPATRPILAVLWGTDAATGDDLIVGTVVLCPTWAARRMAIAAQQLGVLQEHYARHASVRAFGIAAADAPATVEEAVGLHELADQATTAAQSLVWQHPSIMNLDAVSSCLTKQLVDESPLLAGVVTAAQNLIGETGTYGQLLPQWGADGKQQQITINGQSAPVTSFQPFMVDGTTYKGITLPTQLTSGLRQTTGQTISAVINQVQDDVALEGSSWVQPTGTAPTTRPVGTVPPAPISVALPAAVDPSATTTTTVPPPTNLNFTIESGWQNGTQMTLNGITTVTVPVGDKNVTVPVITVRVFNNNEKVYGIYGRFFDAAHKQIPLDGSLSATDVSVPFGTLYACPTILGIPIFGQNWVDYQVQLPPNAIGVDLVMATIGGLSGWQTELVDDKNNQLYPGVVFPPQCKLPVIWTTVLNLALPTLMLTMDVIALGSVLKQVFADAFGVTAPELIDEITAYFRVIRLAFGADVLDDLFNGSLAATQFGGPGKPTVLSIILELGLALVGMLSLPLLYPLLALVLAGATAEEAAKALPIMGIVLMVVSAAADLALLGQTIGEIANDTWMTTRHLTGTYDTTVEVSRDPGQSTFPISAVSWTLTPHLFEGETLAAIVDTNFQPNGPVKDAVTIPVPQVTFGGKIRFSIVFLDQNGWTVGAGSTPWLDNFDPTNLPHPSFNITELAPPVSSATTFERRWTTQYDTTAAAYTWSTAATIPGTITDEQTCTAPTDLCRAGDITIATGTGYLGYTWQTPQGWFARQLAFSQTPGTGAAGIDTPFPIQPLLLYDGIGQDAATGHNFLLDPIAGADAYHVRQLDLTAADLGLDRTTSWGVFLDTIHGVVMHPAGKLVGFNTDSGKLHILQLPSAGLDEAIAPTARMHAGTGNADGSRPGLTQQPVSVAIALNGIVLVLEQGASRIQAFDLGGNPTKYFSANGVANASYYLNLEQKYTYLGHSVDGGGYVYTLSYTGDGTDPDQYGVDIYQPGGDHLARATNVNGAAFTVDYWRNNYTQNFVGVQQTSGGLHLLAPANVAEPSVSVWIPNTPNPKGA